LHRTDYCGQIETSMNYPGLQALVRWSVVEALLPSRGMRKNQPMKNFSNASFPPEVVNLMQTAMEAAVATLPDPVSSAHIQSIAETILRTAKEGERDPVNLQRMALLELQITPRD